MTLDEHIAKAEEDAKMAEFDTEWGIGNYFIDRAEALEYAKECRNLVNWLKDYKRLSEQEQADGWHDSEDPPGDDRYILLSFSNFSLPINGRYEEGEDGDGNYYIGDDTESALSQDMIVNGWMELPKCRED